MEINLQLQDHETPQEKVYEKESNELNTLDQSANDAPFFRIYKNERKNFKMALLKIILLIIVAFLLSQLTKSVARKLKDSIQDASYDIVNKVIDGKMNTMVNNLNKIQFQNQQEEL